MLALTLSLCLAAQPVGLTRLDLVRVWEAAQLFHPSVVHRELDLDAAFTKAMTQFEAAKDEPGRRAAIASLLESLGDPASRLVAPASAPTPGPFLVRDGPVAILRPGNNEASTARTDKAALEAALAEARFVVVDLRGADAFDLPVSMHEVVTLAPTQTIMHSGFGNGRAGLYGPRLEVRPGSRFGGDEAKPRKWAIIVDPSGLIPDWAMALRAAGRGVFVSSGAVTDDFASDTRDEPLPEGWVARVRVAEFQSGPRLSTDVPVTRGQDAIDTAKRALLANAKVHLGPPRAPEPMRPMTFPKGTPGVPDRAHRFLGAARLWMISKRFFAYPELRLVDPDVELPRLLTRLETTSTLRDWDEALRDAAARLLPDNHTFLQTEGLDELRSPPFTVRLVGQQVAVTSVSANAAPIEPWDVVVSVDGTPIDTLVTERARHLPGSRDYTRRVAALEWVFVAPIGSRHTVTVRKPDGRVVDAQLTYDSIGISGLQQPRTGPAAGVLAGNIGYLDLDRLESGAADAAFELIRDTRALVVDLRGYPRLDDGFTFATRLGTATPLGFARLCVPLVAAEAGPTHLRRCDWSMHAAVSDPRPHYTHPVVVLINNGSQSYSEHLGLALEAYANATFVGTPSAGADGNISWVSLVGGAATSFGAMAATHFDGRQLQGVGLQPQVVVEPTLAGLRAGKDEVLERGVQEASKQAAAAH